MSESRTPEEVDEYEDLLDEAEHRWRNRVIGLAVLAALVVAGGYALWAMVLGGEDESTEEIQTAEVERGSISVTVSTSGVAVAQSTSNLSFGQSGRVTAVYATLGQKVKAGDVLAEVESDTLQDAIATAEMNVASAQVKLNQLLEGADAAEVASADQSVLQAQANLDQANRALQDLFEGPPESEQLSAEQAVSSAQAKFDQANRALQDVLKGPTESERLSAEQAVASAESQLAKAEASRAQLYSASEAAIAAAEEAVRKAQKALENAERSADDSSRSLASAEASLKSAETAYCLFEEDGGDPKGCRDATFCAQRVAPISPADEAILREVTVTGTPGCAKEAAAVLADNASYMKALTSKESAEDAVDSARADLEAAQRDLDEARMGPSSEDIAEADASAAAAQRALDVANAKLAELNQGPTQSELEDAQDNVDSAHAALDLAKVKLAELNQGPTQDELAQAQSNLDAAAMALAVAQAKRKDVYAGADPEEIDLERRQVQLAERSVEQARKDLEKAKIVAPFDGTVEELNIQVGDEAGGAGEEAAIVLNTPDAVYLDLMITESDRPSIEAGQSGVASFDAIEDRPFPVVIESVGTNPTTTQGIVTYEVRARILTGLPAEVAGALPSGAPAGRASAQAGTPAAGATPSAGGRGLPGAEATPTGTPVPGATPFAGTPAAGATPSAGGRGLSSAEATPAATPGAGTTPSAATPAAGAAPSAGGTRALPSGVDTEAKPLPGMNASVTITVEQAQDVLTVPSQAIQLEGRNSIVEVLKEDGTTEKVVVETGISDGTTTEIVSGLEEGQTIIIPRGTAAAVQPTPGAGFPQFPEGGFPGGERPEGGAR